MKYFGSRGRMLRKSLQGCLSFLGVAGLVFAGGPGNRWKLSPLDQTGGRTCSGFPERTHFVGSPDTQPSPSDLNQIN